MTEGQPGFGTTIITRVQQRQYALYGFIAGVVTTWALGGFQGQYNGLFVVAGVVIYIWYINRSKPEPKDIYDVIRAAAIKHKQKTGQSLNWKTAKVYNRGGDRYFMQFTEPTVHMTIKAPGVKGIQEITPRSAESMKTEKDNMYMETHEYEIE